MPDGGASASAFTFQREGGAALAEEMKPLVARHWQETGMATEEAVLAPAYEKYISADKLGLLRVYTARRCGELVGYAVYFVGTGLHASTTRSATADMMWLAPEARLPLVGLRLLRFIEGELTREGIRLMRTDVNEDHPAAGRLLEHMGHRQVGRIYRKLLGGDHA